MRFNYYSPFTTCGLQIFPKCIHTGTFLPVQYTSISTWVSFADRFCPSIGNVLPIG